MFADFVEIIHEGTPIAINRANVLNVMFYEEQRWRPTMPGEPPPPMPAAWKLIIRTVGDYNNGDNWPSWTFANRELVQEAYNTIVYGTKHGKGETA